MRTTLDIDEDVLNAAKELARRENASAGQVVSRLLREILTRTAETGSPPKGASRSATGFRPFSQPGKLVTNEQVDALRDSEGV